MVKFHAFAWDYLDDDEDAQWAATAKVDWKHLGAFDDLAKAVKVVAKYGRRSENDLQARITRKNGPVLFEGHTYEAKAWFRVNYPDRADELLSASARAAATSSTDNSTAEPLPDSS